MLGRKEFLFRQIGAKVAYYRKIRNLTQGELADKIHISRSSIGKIERGAYNHNVSMSILIDIVDGLEIDLSALFTFTEQEKKIWQKKKRRRRKKIEIKIKGGKTYCGQEQSSCLCYSAAAVIN